MVVRKTLPEQLSLHQLGGITPATDSLFAWLTVPAIASPVHAGLHCRDRLVCLTVAADSAVIDFRFTVVMINYSWIIF